MRGKTAPQRARARIEVRCRAVRRCGNWRASLMPRTRFGGADAARRPSPGRGMSGLPGLPALPLCAGLPAPKMLLTRAVLRDH